MRIYNSLINLTPKIAFKASNEERDLTPEELDKMVRECPFLKPPRRLMQKPAIPNCGIPTINGKTPDSDTFKKAGDEMLANAYHLFGIDEISKSGK